MTQLSGPERPALSGQTQQLIVFLHGLGADGNDLIGLAPLFAELFPNAHFLSPNAPEPCDMAPYGYQWFSLQDRNPHVLLAGVRRAAPMLDAFLDAQLARFGLDASAMALVGFSQGTMMSLYCAPRRAQEVAGVVGFSGALVGAEAMDGAVCSRPHTCLIHGTADMVVPFGAMEYAQSVLETHDVPVESYARPGLGHGIDEEGIAIAAEFLRKRFGL